MSDRSSDGTSGEVDGDAASVVTAPRPRRPLWITAPVLFVVALSLRPDVIGIGPLLEPIQAAFGSSRGVVGLLATIPIVAIGVCSPLSARLGRRIGAERVVLLGLAVLAACGMGRSLTSDIRVLLLLTAGVGVGVALVQTLLPAIVRAHAAQHVAGVTTVYVMGIQLGAAGGAGWSAYVGTLLSWRVPLLTFGALAGVWALLWALYSWRPVKLPLPAVRTPPGRDAALWRSRLVWLLVVIYGSQSFVYFGTSAWLSGYLQQRGWDPTPAGNAVSLLNLAGLVATLLTPTLLARAGSERRAMMLAGGLASVALTAILIFPQAGLPLALLAGLGMGPLLPTILQLPIKVTDHIDDVGAVSGIMLGVGYLIAASSPTLLGALRDATDTFVSVFMALVAVMLGFVLICLRLSPRRVAVGVRDLHDA